MNLAEDEADAIGQVRRFLSHLPSSVWEAPPEVTPDDDPDRRAESLLSAVPQDRRRTYDPYEIVGAVVDEGSFFEIGPHYGRARVTGLARVDGIPCGVMSNDPRFNGGSMDIAAGEKMLRLLELRETFHLPLVYFADEPGFSVGPAQERLGIVRAGARVVTALNLTRTPYICFVVRQLYGVAGGLHWRGQGLYRRYAWPSAHGGSMHIQGGTAIAYSLGERAFWPASWRRRGAACAVLGKRGLSSARSRPSAGACFWPPSAAAGQMTRAPRDTASQRARRSTRLRGRRGP